MDVALYFPYISVPPGSWFTRVLLYWDGVASVVPQHLSDRDAELTPFMRKLVKANLVRRVSPERAQWDNQHGFDAGFLAMLGASGVAEADEPRQWTRMHREKATLYLFEQIADRQLGHWDRNSPQWFVMEKRTAGLYMAYLVGSICRVDGDLMPVTDAGDSLELLAQPADGSKPKLDELVSVTVHDVLPVPSKPIPVDQLSRFKDDNVEQLHNLRVHLKGKLADLVLIQDETVRAAKTAEAQREIGEHVRRLEETMKRRRWPIVLGGAAALGAPVLGIAAAVVTGGAALALGLGVASGVSGLGGAAAAMQRQPRIDRNSPVAYAALAGHLQPARRRLNVWPYRQVTQQTHSGGFALLVTLYLV
jgi:hypothetical protein